MASFGRVVADRGRDDLADRQGRAVVHRHHTHLILGVLQHHRLEAGPVLDDLGHLGQELGLVRIQAQGEQPVLGHHHEFGQVDGVGAFAQHRALRALLAAGLEERARVLEIHHARVARERLVGRQGPAVAGEHIADAALGNGHQGSHMQPVLERHEEVQAAAQHLGLEAGLAAQGDQAAADRAAPAPQLLDDGDPVVADVPDDAGQAHENDRQNDGQRRTDIRPERM